jgi:hypothetical protein
MCIDMKSKKSTYLGGQIPLEDEGLKKVLMLGDKFIDRVERAIEYSDKANANRSHQVLE